jgi:N-methylhydantoinase B
MPDSLDDIEGELDLASPAYITGLSKDDVWIRQNEGGGGYGDPLERDSEMVLADVLNGAVSLESACESYGVVIDIERQSVDERATARQRERIIETRKASFKKVPQ